VPLVKVGRFKLVLTGALVSVRPPLAILISHTVFLAAADGQIVAFGASNVAGQGLWPWQAWPAQLEVMLKTQGYNVHVKNAGKSGDTTSGMLHRLNFAVPNGTQIVILAHARGSDTVQGREDINAIQVKLKSRGIIVIPEYNPDRLPLVLKQPDHHHLTAEGCKVLAQRMLPQVISALDRSSSGG
jgi:acyl-CoA thioesterase I